MRPMSDNEIRDLQERVWKKIGPLLRAFCHFVAGFTVLYLICGFFGDPSHFTRHAYWVHLAALAVPLSLFGYFGMFSRETPSAR